METGNAGGKRHVSLAITRRQHDLHRIAGQGDLGENVDSVNVRHDHVENYDVGLKRDEFIDREARIVDSLALKAECPGDKSDDSGDSRLVVHDQQFLRHSAHSRSQGGGPIEKIEK